MYTASTHVDTGMMNTEISFPAFIQQEGQPSCWMNAGNDISALIQHDGLAERMLECCVQH